MTIQLMDLRKWQCLEDGNMVQFTKKNPRVVRIDVNTPFKVTLWYAEENEDAKFLALVEGRDRVEFAVDGPFDLTVEGGDCWFYTVDGADFSMQAVDDRTFTRIAERRTRNPELDYMMQVMYQNMERRIQQTASDLERQHERREKARQRDIERSAQDGRSADRPAGTSTNAGDKAVPAKSSQGGQSSGGTPESASSVPAGGDTSKK